MGLFFDGALSEGVRQSISFTTQRAAGTRIYVTTFDAPANTIKLLLLVDLVRTGNASEPTRGYPIQIAEVRRQNFSFALNFATQSGDTFIITPLYDWPRVKMNDNV